MQTAEKLTNSNNRFLVSKNVKRIKFYKICDRNYLHMYEGEYIGKKRLKDGMVYKVKVMINRSQFEIFNVYRNEITELIMYGSYK